MASSSLHTEKVQTLERENQELKACMKKLEGQMSDLASSRNSVLSGSDLVDFKASLYPLNTKVAQSLCSENNESVDGAMSLLGERRQQ
jgi:hypothetical protein